MLTNGMNVGGTRRARRPRPGALAAGRARRSTSRPVRGFACRSSTTATIRFFRLRLTDSRRRRRSRSSGSAARAACSTTRASKAASSAGFDFKYGAGEILLDPGDRADVVAAIPAGGDRRS